MELTIEHNKLESIRKALLYDKLPPLLQLRVLLIERKQFALSGNFEGVNIVNKKICALMGCEII